MNPNSIVLNQWFSIGGSGPTFWVAGHLLLGCQNLCYSTIISINWSPNCVLFCIVGRQPSNVDNHWFKVYLDFQGAVLKNAEKLARLYHPSFFKLSSLLQRNVNSVHVYFKFSVLQDRHQDFRFYVAKMVLKSYIIIFLSHQ